MNPEDRVLLERTLKLSEENNRILHRMQRAARWAILWGFIKVLILVVPIVLGIIYLQPFVRDIMVDFNSVKELLNFRE